MPIFEREVLMARAIGRALAHELGHYFLASKEHTKKGLMKAHRTAVEFFGQDARPFTGTSAAAPQAAGLAALVWSRHPDWTAAQVQEALRTAARDLGPAGHDFETGYGLIHLPGK